MSRARASLIGPAPLSKKTADAVVQGRQAARQVQSVSVEVLERSHDREGVSSADYF
jgi:hypothetical protein